MVSHNDPNIQFKILFFPNGFQTNLDRLLVFPNHGLSITFPQKVDFFSSPGLWDSQGHFKPTGPPSSTETVILLLSWLR